MKTLALLRHAKSDWSDRSLEDFERPLAPRGIKAARRVGKAMQALGVNPELVLCSDARRARETWDLAGAELSGQPPVVLRHGLYLASPKALLDEIQRPELKVQTLLLVGHNPGLENLALALAAPNSDPEAVRSMREKFPTAALAILYFEIDSWADAKCGAGRLAQFIRPRDLN